ncbi:CBS domain-containing protein [Aliifodinibius salicampi]|uniref:CBS domain-containing protein n=1 Tax=Fodinibius salicampi TaxID=1920655 RepID=A0ABT3Q355_9BACT|nr:CBS domain-containing protein [Fodinibius salicampi]MCW9714533.1 CBS domain-containing protein [Fodinibius salicampi]
MLVTKKLITSKFEPLKGDTSLESVKKRMEESGIYTLPVVDSTTHALIGQVSLRQLDGAEEGQVVSDLELEEPVKVYRSQHIFEAARLFLQYEREILPVIDEEWTLLGVITRDVILEHLAQLLNVAETGSAITVTLDRIDFSISEIVNIIETEGAKILGMTVEKPSESQQTFTISFVLDIQDVSRVAAALRRYDYIVATDSENEVLRDDLENRADELIKYIDM